MRMRGLFLLLMMVGVSSGFLYLDVVADDQKKLEDYTEQELESLEQKIWESIAPEEKESFQQLNVVSRQLTQVAELAATELGKNGTAIREKASRILSAFNELKVHRRFQVRRVDLMWVAEYYRKAGEHVELAHAQTEKWITSFVRDGRIEILNGPEANSGWGRAEMEKAMSYANLAEELLIASKLREYQTLEQRGSATNQEKPQVDAQGNPVASGASNHAFCARCGTELGIRTGFFNSHDTIRAIREAKDLQEASGEVHKMSLSESSLWIEGDEANQSPDIASASRMAYVRGFLEAQQLWEWEIQLAKHVGGPHPIRDVTHTLDGATYEEVVDLMMRFYKENPEYHRVADPAVVIIGIVPRLRRGEAAIPPETQAAWDLLKQTNASQDGR
jgi:hypothetical protein